MNRIIAEQPGTPKRSTHRVGLSQQANNTWARDTRLAGSVRDRENAALGKSERAWYIIPYETGGRMFASPERWVLFGLLGTVVTALFLPELGKARVPEPPSTIYDQVEVCWRALNRFSGVQESSLRSGIVLWGCDSDAVIAEPDLGQEYCEYNALSGGRIVRTAREIAPAAGLRCVFTAVFSDTQHKDAKLLDAMADQANLGVKPEDASVVRMTRRTNSRETARSLIERCSARGSAQADAASIDELRQSACFQAAISESGISDKFREICRGRDLSEEMQWAKAVELGAKVLNPGEEGYEEQRDLAACAATKRLGGGLPWRTPDLLTCGRVRRATTECGCSYDVISSSVDGFSFGGWTSSIVGAVGCRKTKVDGTDYDHIVICDISEGDLDDLSFSLDSAENLQGFCRKKFTTVLPLRAPIREFQKRGVCKPNATTFCAANSAQVP